MLDDVAVKGFGTKAALAKAVFDLVIAGDDEPVPVWRRSEADAIRELYELLVVERGRPLDRSADWIGQAMTAALVQPERGRRN